MDRTGLGGFEPPASGLEARRYVLAKPQAQRLIISLSVVINPFFVFYWILENPEQFAASFFWKPDCKPESRKRKKLLEKSD